MCSRAKYHSKTLFLLCSCRAPFLSKLIFEQLQHHWPFTFRFFSGTKAATSKSCPRIRPDQWKSYIDSHNNALIEVVIVIKRVPHPNSIPFVLAALWNEAVISDNAGNQRCWRHIKGRVPWHVMLAVRHPSQGLSKSGSVQLSFESFLLKLLVTSNADSAEPSIQTPIPGAATRWVTPSTFNEQSSSSGRS